VAVAAFVVPAVVSELLPQPDAASAHTTAARRVVIPIERMKEGPPKDRAVGGRRRAGGA
jgi:hypothetical protein